MRDIEGERGRERQRHRKSEKQAPCREPAREVCTSCCGNTWAGTWPRFEEMLLSEIIRCLTMSLSSCLLRLLLALTVSQTFLVFLTMTFFWSVPEHF
ncbi:unnamed protein product [Nyctereutes procyonoides]|uniref:(raccoon dog) hypothetical protein n=1 Tax=Nyctereutes procyonoides TaxID=34880 RepID=A0A811ZND5_NYCPR|nr:unnamed protein product [Nyctereutes procyonoides]